MDTERQTAEPPKRSAREERAFGWISGLSELPERAAGSPSEREAAARVAGWMKELGLGAARIEPVPARPRSGWGLALHAAVAGAGLLLGGVFGAALALLAALSFRAEMRGRGRWLSRLLPAPASVNVVASTSVDAPRARVVLSAHIDAAQAGWLFAKPLADFFAARAQRGRRDGDAPPGPNALPEAILMGAGLVALASGLGASGLLLDLARLGVGAALLLVLALGAQWASARCSPGANDNASAVAAMLTCAEQLLALLPADVELWLVGTGAEEVGCCGMHALLAAHPDWRPEATYFVNFECVGGGALHWIRSEGTLGKTRLPAAAGGAGAPRRGGR